MEFKDLDPSAKAIETKAGTQPLIQSEKLCLKKKCCIILVYICIFDCMYYSNEKMVEHDRKNEIRDVEKMAHNVIEFDEKNQEIIK